MRMAKVKSRVKNRPPETTCTAYTINLVPGKLEGGAHESPKCDAFRKFKATAKSMKLELTI